MRDAGVDNVASVASIGIALHVRSCHVVVTECRSYKYDIGASDSGVTFTASAVRFGRIVENLEMETYSYTTSMAITNSNYFIVKNWRSLRSTPERIRQDQAAFVSTLKLETDNNVLTYRSRSRRFSTIRTKEQWTRSRASFIQVSSPQLSPQYFSSIECTTNKYFHNLNFVCFLLGNSPAPEFYMPTFRDTLSVPSS
jgi:hypothetical protein